MALTTHPTPLPSTLPLASPEGLKFSRDEVKGQLERILESPPFRSSRRCSRFLRYVVEAACDGRTEELRERVLGVTVFDRRPDYDTNEDPVVRTAAGEVRKRLAQYYCEIGHEHELRITLSPGSYVPEIDLSHEMASVHSGTRSATPAGRRWIWWFISVASAAVAAILALALSSDWRRTDLDLFWAPLFDQPGSLILCLGQPQVYRFALDRRMEMNRLFEEMESGREPQGFASLSLQTSDIVSAADRFIAMSDSQTMIRIAGLSAKRGKQVEVRGGRATSLADLRGKPSVFVGGFSNPWTMSLTRDLRFSFARKPDDSGEYVHDRKDPGKRDWMVRYSDGDATPVDYAIISRFRHPTTEAPIVIAAGIHGAGTRTAGEFLTNPAYFKKALEGAPPDWYRKNMQIVLSTHVMSGQPGPPQVVAIHFW